MGSNNGTLKKKKIGTICAVPVCSQFIKHNAKHSRALNTRKRKCL